MARGKHAEAAARRRALAESDVVAELRQQVHDLKAEVDRLERAETKVKVSNEAWDTMLHERDSLAHEVEGLRKSERHLEQWKEDATVVLEAALPEFAELTRERSMSARFRIALAGLGHLGQLYWDAISPHFGRELRRQVNRRLGTDKRIAETVDELAINEGKSWAAG